jgi:hypothetical protein
LTEIRRLLDVASERYLHFTEMMGSSARFSGHADRSKIDAAIAAAAKKREAENKPLASQAYDRPQN